MEDPWKDREKVGTCRTCMFFIIKQSRSGDSEIGRCRRNAPTRTGYPVVYPTDWCGEHKIDENKLIERVGAGTGTAVKTRFPETDTQPERR